MHLFNRNSPAAGYSFKKIKGKARLRPLRAPCGAGLGAAPSEAVTGPPSRRWRRPARPWRPWGLAAPCGSAGTRWGGGGCAGQGGGAGAAGLTRVPSQVEWVPCPYDVHHRVPRASLERHSASCRLRRMGYSAEEEVRAPLGKRGTGLALLPRALTEPFGPAGRDVRLQLFLRKPEGSHGGHG